MEYEAVIGLEVHVQIKTHSKMFTRAPYRYGEAPNTLTDPVVMGLPGALPVLNKEAILKTLTLGRMLGCQLARVTHWDRKNYFYPDLPKGYQISQYDQPLCRGGEVEIELPGAARNLMGEHRGVRLNRIHLEEDVGKLTHGAADSLVDFNRAGCPLAEIVTEPDMHTPEEVVAFLNALRNVLLYGGISDCDMEKGQLRCDANISVRLKGDPKLGPKVELKNLNSISGVKNGVIYEVKRQIECLKQGERVVHQTRRWDADAGLSFPMRTKEEVHDYRYFPDPDLRPLVLSEAFLEGLPVYETPFDKQRRFFQQYDLPYTLTAVLCPDIQLCNYFEEAVAHYANPKNIANWIVNDLLRDLRQFGGSLPLSECKIRPADLADLVRLLDEGVLTKTAAQQIFALMFESGRPPQALAQEHGLLQQSLSVEELQEVCRQVIASSPKPVAEFRAGKVAALNALKGQVMRQTQGKARPQEIDATLQSLLQS